MPVPREIPLVKMAIPVIMGIWLQPYLKLSLSLLTVSFILAFIAVLLLQKIYTLGWLHKLRSAWIYILFFILGIFVHHQKNESTKNTFISENLNNKLSFVIACESIPKRTKTTRFVGTLSHIGYHADSLKSIRPIKVLVNIFNLGEEIKVGQNILVNAQLKRTPNTLNPAAFNYARYLKHQSILYQTYFSANDILAISDQIPSTYFLKGKIRGKAINTFERYLSGDNLAVGLALVLGFRDYIDDDLYRAFTETGSMHVLAVSGLHVGILTWFLGLLMGFVRHNAVGWKILKGIVLIGCVVLFAILTGGSPSVVRASIMFSILEMSKIAHGHYSVYNSLGAAAIVMLIWDPYNLYQVGFQLSFTAILSIVLFFHRINSLLSFSTWLPDKLWKMMSVALSVQILTFPIALFYFHQFPIYFFITGISAVFLAMLILASGLVLLVLSIIPVSLEPLFTIYDFLLSTLVNSTRYIQDLPFALIKNIRFDQLTLILVFVAIVAFSVYFLQANRRALILGMVATCIVLTYNSVMKIRNYTKSEIIVYDTKYPLVDIISAANCYTFADQRLNEKNIKYATENYRLSRRIEDVHIIQSKEELEHLLVTNGHRMKDFEFKSYLSDDRRKEDFQAIFSIINNSVGLDSLEWK